MEFLMRASTLLLIVVALGGCASMSADECRSADWQTIGYEDGTRGLPPEHIGRHRKACAKVNVTPRLDAYNLGRAKGLREFCKPNNAYKMASDGYEYRGICPADMEDEFLEAYEEGRVLYELKSEVSRIEDEISDLNKDLRDAEKDIENAEEELVSDDVDSETRRELLATIKELNRDIRYFDEELVHKRMELRHSERRFEEYRDSISSYSGLD